MSTLKTLIVIFTLTTTSASAQQMARIYHVSNLTEHEIAILKCFQDAPWVDKDHLRDKCISNIKF